MVLTDEKKFLPSDGKIILPPTVRSTLFMWEVLVNYRNFPHEKCGSNLENSIGTKQKIAENVEK